MDIYSILSSKPHNPHYLNKYILFISKCQQNNVDYESHVENHHICPKADDMFPEYICFSKNPWNKLPLTPRQHFIAHMMLHKMYKWSKSQHFAVFMFSFGEYNKSVDSSKKYERLRREFSEKQSKLVRMVNEREMKSGTHTFQRKNFQKDVQQKRLAEGTHHFLDSGYQREMALKRIENGTHHFLNDEFLKENSKRTTKMNKERVENGTHQFLGKVISVDRNGNTVSIDSSIYQKHQIGDPKNRLFVHVNSHEGKRRKAEVVSLPHTL